MHVCIDCGVMLQSSNVRLMLAHQISASGLRCNGQYRRQQYVEIKMCFKYVLCSFAITLLPIVIQRPQLNVFSAKDVEAGQFCELSEHTVAFRTTICWLIFVGYCADPRL